MELDRADPKRTACMAFFESALLHARVLHEFLAEPPKREDDVWAGHYVPGWTPCNGGKGPLGRVGAGRGRDVRASIHKQLAHMSSERLKQVKYLRTFQVLGKFLVPLALRRLVLRVQCCCAVADFPHCVRAENVEYETGLTSSLLLTTGGLCRILQSCVRSEPSRRHPRWFLRECLRASATAMTATWKSLGHQASKYHRDTLIFGHRLGGFAGWPGSSRPLYVPPVCGSRRNGSPSPSSFSQP
jgi:hypothetical protein